MPSKNPASKFIELTIKTPSSMRLKVLANIQNLYLIVSNIEALQMKKQKSFDEVFSHRLEKLQNMVFIIIFEFLPFFSSIFVIIAIF